MLRKEEIHTLTANSGIVPDNSRIAQGIYIVLSSGMICAQSRNRVGQSRNSGQCKVRKVGQKITEGCQIKIYEQKTGMDHYAEKRKISKLEIAEDTDQKSNNKDFMTILSAAMARVGLICI